MKKTKRSANDTSWKDRSTTSDGGRRYAVEQAIARARNSRPWQERSSAAQSAERRPHQRHPADEDCDVS